MIGGGGGGGARGGDDCEWAAEIFFPISDLIAVASDSLFICILPFRAHAIL